MCNELFLEPKYNQTLALVRRACICNSSRQGLSGNLSSFAEKLATELSLLWSPQCFEQIVLLSSLDVGLSLLEVAVMITVARTKSTSALKL